MARNILKIIKSNKGETLVEVIIGVLLLAIASLMLSVGFGTCAGLINEANEFKNESARVSTIVDIEDVKSTESDEDKTVQKNDGIIKLDKDVIVQGYFYNCEDHKTGVNYSSFIPNTIKTTESGDKESGDKESGDNK